MPRLANANWADDPESQERHDHPGAVRCCKCPKARAADESGWYFLDPSKLRGTLRHHVVFVCPVHYEQFAASERVRWEAIDQFRAPAGAASLAGASPAADDPVCPPGRPLAASPTPDPQPAADELGLSAPAAALS